MARGYSSFNDNFSKQAKTLHLYALMISREDVYGNEFLSIISNHDELQAVENLLISDKVLLDEVISDELGFKRVQIILENSKDSSLTLFYKIMSKFPEIMNRRGNGGYSLALQILNTNKAQKDLFCQYAHRHMLELAHNKNGCKILKKVITVADDHFKSKFLDLIAEQSHSLCTEGLGISLVQHMLKLDFTRETTQDDTRLHRLMAEFDETFKRTDFAELHRLALNLTSDSELFIEFVNTMRGSLLVQIILGKSEEIDTMVFQVIKRRIIDIVTNRFGSLVVLRVTHVFEKRGDFEVECQIQDKIIWNAVQISKDPIGSSFLLQHVVDFNDEDFSRSFGYMLYIHRGYIELSFDKYGSIIMQKVIDNLDNLEWMVRDIIKCDEDTLVRLAKDHYGNKLLKLTLEHASGRKVDLYGDLVKKLKPFVESLRGTRGDNIAAIIDYIV